MAVSKEIHKIVTDEDGVVKEREYTGVINFGEEPPYVKMYIQDMLYFTNVPKRYEDVTKALLKRVSYAGDEYGLCVTVNKAVKTSMCKELGWNNPISVDNAIQVLLKGKIVRRIDRGIYQFNPYLFGRGNWADIAKLRLMVNYDEIKGRRFCIVAGLQKTEDDKFWDEVNKEE